MSDAAAPEKAVNAKAGEPQKSKKKLIIIIVAALVLIGGGGSGAFYFFKHSNAAAKERDGKSKDELEEDDKKSDSKAHKSKNDEEEGDQEGDQEADREAEDEEAPKRKNKSLNIALPDDSKVKAVVELQPYVVNLADQGEARYLRMTVSVGVGGGDEKEEKPSPLFTTRVRNAMLAVLTTKTSEEVLTSEGKMKLRKELLRAARAACHEPRIEAIYITEFIIQL